MGSNCVASASIGCLFCCKGCNAEKLRNAFTFMPPTSSYIVEADPKDSTKNKIIYRMEALNVSGLYRQAAETAEVRWVRTRRDSHVPMVWLRSKASQIAASQDSAGRSEASSGSAEPGIVLLHCHGNATDIGMMMGPYFELSKILGIDVVGVEYSGYGVASGKPSSSNCYADVEAAYDELVRLGVSPTRIVAYGQSIGSGPVSGLAIKRQLGGIILHSPLLSGIKVIDPEPERCCRPSCVYTCFDFFPNDRRVKQIKSPVFIMHGRRDDVVPFYHGHRLHEDCPKDYRWPAYFPHRAGHNDIVETDMRAYFGEVSNFLQDVKRRANGIEVRPPSDTKSPKQVEMSQKQPFPPHPSKKSRPSASAPEKTGLIEAEHKAGDGLELHSDAASSSVAKAGPEDGRYQAIRSRGDIRPAVSNAREVQVVSKTAVADCPESSNGLGSASSNQA